MTEKHQIEKRDGSTPSEDSARAGVEWTEGMEKLSRVMTGCLESLPALSSKIVRIFTSSTFTDTTLERNTLMETVYPKLKEYCREKHGLEFQVVDMRWGVRDEATDDHMTTELCMQEIDNCQRLSMGPNFVVFLGQKYGYRPLPTHIPASEFEQLRGCVVGNAMEYDLLNEWYKRDDNMVPPVNVLQPISSIYTNFNNKRHQRLQEQDQAQWWETFGKLQKIIRKASQVLFVTKIIDREQMHNYFMSVTEREIERGILKALSVEEHCLAYIREITNINTTLLRFARNFVDFAARNVDGEAQKLLKALRDDKIPKKLGERNTTRFSVEWSGKEGIDKETHKDYLSDFSEHFHQSVIRLVESAMAKHEKLASDAVYTETLQHLHACHQFCKIFQGREEVVEHIHHYVAGDSDLPLVLFGESGCGKTSLMAKAASEITRWYKPDQKPVMVLRFLGTTPNSSTIVPLLISLCKQIAFIYDQPQDEVPDELAPLILYFKRVISYVTEEKPLVLFLDSLDQLSGADGAHQLAWLPETLPKNVKLIASTLPNYYNLLDTLRRMIGNEENFVQVLPLGENLSSTIIKLWLKNSKRSISEEQWKIVNDAISKCNLPLFVKLVYDEICRWRSYTKPQLTTLAFTIHDSITKLYEKIELQHGKTLVSHAFGYITASKSGLSESELDDLLSLDEKVLNDVYQYHLPPVRRIPPLLWTRLRSDLPGYLSEREADGVNVIDWYHRQFIQAATERYFKNLNFVSEIHSNIADYFLGIWGGVPKPFEYSDLQRQRFLLDERRGESDRKVPVQPLAFTDENGNVLRHNLRKLGELPFHLVRSHRYQDLYQEVLFNYNWLHAKLCCMPMQSLLSDFEDLLAHVYDKDVKLIADAIRLSSSILNSYPGMLGPQIIGRLLPHYSTNPKIRGLIQQCDTDGIHNCALVPAHHCLHTPGGPLQFSLEGHPFAPFGIGVTSDGRYLVSVSNKFIIWDLSNGDVFRTVLPGVEGIMQNLAISSNGKHAVSYTNNNQVIVCMVMTGEFQLLKKPIDENQNALMGIAISNMHLAVWSEKHWFLYTLQGALVSKSQSGAGNIFIAIDFGPDNEIYIIEKNGTDIDSEMSVSVLNCPIDAFDFHSAVAFNKTKSTMYTCIEISDNAVAVYKKQENAWKYDHTLGDNYDKVYGLNISEDESYLVATLALGYKLWDLNNGNKRDLKLPTGIRNIPAKNSLSSPLVFTKNNHFVVAGVRKNLYVWDVKQGNMVKILDAHFGRIISLTSVVHGGNKVISSSIDKTIKAWNFDNILEDVHSIDRQEKPIETIRLASGANIAITTARVGIGVWQLETGRLLKTLANSSPSSVVSQAVITKEAEYIISAETLNLILWDVEKEKVLKTRSQKDILQFKLLESDTKVLTISKAGPMKALCVCYSVPELNETYKFEYAFKNFREAIVTSDGLFLVLPAHDKSGDIISVYHAKTGTGLYNIQLKYSNYKELSSLVAMPHDPNLIAVIDADKGNILDLKKKTLVRSVSRWNGMCTSNGRLGLYAPNRGGLQTIELKAGKTVQTLIPRVAEGVFSNNVMFTTNDRYVLYYHSGRRTIRVFRVDDGKQIANFKAHAEVKAMTTSPGGASVITGAVDGSLTVLAIADLLYPASQELLMSLPSRQLQASTTPNQSPRHLANGDMVKMRHTVGTAVQVARFVAKSRGSQKSRACAIS